MEIHIGETIRKRAKELRIGATELADMINTSRSNIYWLYKRKHIDGELLMKLSRALKFNFFKLYRDEMVLDEPNKNLKLYKTPPEDMNHLLLEVAELKEKYNVLVKSLKKKKK